MKLGMMQPYFFPYLGYFGLIKNTDKWIVLDNVQFITRGWIARNRIMKFNEGWTYIGVPLLKHSSKAIIKDVKIKNNEKWKNRLFRQLAWYKKIAPYYSDVIDFLQDSFKYSTDSISRLNTHLLKSTCNYLEIEMDYQIFSEMDLTIDTVKQPDEWALNISKALGASAYINPPGGMGIYNPEKFHRSNIDFKFLQIALNPYDQKRPVFQSGLSILDVMMFNSPGQIRAMLDDYKLL